MRNTDKWGRWRRALLAVSTVAVLLVPAGPAHADNYWGGMHWQRGGPAGSMAGYLTFGGYRYIGVHNAVDQTGWFPGAIAEATERWNDTNWHAAVLVPANLDPSQFPYPCDWTPPPNEWGIVICTGYPTNPAAQADATIMGVNPGAHFGWVRIRIRPGLALTQDQVKRLLTHELGHALGLYHREPQQGSVMDYNGGWNGGWPDAHDMNTVAALYDHIH